MRLMDNCPHCGSVITTGDIYCQKCQQPIYEKNSMYNQNNKLWREAIVRGNGF